MHNGTDPADDGSRERGCDTREGACEVAGDEACERSSSAKGELVGKVEPAREAGCASWGAMLSRCANCASSASRTCG